MLDPSFYHCTDHIIVSYTFYKSCNNKGEALLFVSSRNCILVTVPAWSVGHSNCLPLLIFRINRDSALPRGASLLKLSNPPISSIFGKMSYYLFQGKLRNAYNLIHIAIWDDCKNFQKPGHYKHVVSPFGLTYIPAVKSA